MFVYYYSVLKRNELQAITKWKKPVWKGKTLYDSNYMTFRKCKTMETVKWLGDGGKKKDEYAEHRRFLGQ